MGQTRILTTKNGRNNTKIRNVFHFKKTPLDNYFLFKNKSRELLIDKYGGVRLFCKGFLQACKEGAEQVSLGREFHR